MNNKLKFFMILIGVMIAMVLAVPLVFASSWSAKTYITNNSHEDNEPSIAIHQGKAYVIYVGGEGNNSEIYYKTNKSGVWGNPIQLTSNSTADSSPDIAIDENGKAHVVHLTSYYNSTSKDWNREVVYRTNVSGVWKLRRLTSDSVHQENPSIAVHNGKAHIVYGTRNWKAGTQEVWYVSNSSGSWVYKKITANGVAKEGGSIAQISGKPHISFTNRIKLNNSENAEIFYAKKTPLWDIIRVTYYSSTDATPDIAIDSQGKAHIAFERAYEIFYTTNKSGKWQETKLSNNSVSDNSPSIAVSGGNVFVVWERWDPWGYSGDSEIYFKKKGSSGWSAPQQLTNNKANDMIPSIAAYNGKAQIVYVTENPDGDIVFLKQY